MGKFALLLAFISMIACSPEVVSEQPSPPQVPPSTEPAKSAGNERLALARQELESMERELSLAREKESGPDAVLGMERKVQEQQKKIAELSRELAVKNQQSSEVVALTQKVQALIDGIEKLKAQHALDEAVLQSQLKKQQGEADLLRKKVEEQEAADIRAKYNECIRRENDAQTSDPFGNGGTRPIDLDCEKILLPKA